MGWILIFIAGACLGAGFSYIGKTVAIAAHTNPDLGLVAGIITSIGIIILHYADKL